MPLPNQTWIKPRMTSDTPIVMMISGTGSAVFTGSIASLSTATPTAAGSKIANNSANGRGIPALRKNTASMPPSMMNSPWAKLITLLAL